MGEKLSNLIKPKKNQTLMRKNFQKDLTLQKEIKYPTVLLN